MSELSFYSIKKSLGVGSFSQVMLAEHMPTGQLVAIKLLRKRAVKSKDIGSKLKREVKLLRRMRHPHIVRLYQVMKSSQHVFLVTEYVSGGDVYSMLERRGRVSEAEARHYFQQLIAALEYCHSQSIVHRDLKPENLLLDDSSVIKIADFGLATFFQDGLPCMSSCGSPNYAAPEIVSCSAYCGPEVDVWSSGVILFALVSGRLPFDNPSIPLLFKQIRKAEFKLPIEFSDPLKDLILRILNPDPIARLTIPQIKGHPWFTVSIPIHLQISPVILRQFVQKQNTELDRLDLEILNICCSLPHLERLEPASLILVMKNETESQYRVSYDILSDFKNKQALARLYEVNEITHPLFAQPSAKNTKTLKTSTGSRLLNAPVNWTYGFRCPSNSISLLTALFNILQSLSLEWRQVSHNTLRIRTKDLAENTTWSPLLGFPIKADLTVFMFEDSYVLDLRHVSGQSIIFLDFCARLHESLRKSLFV